MTTTPTLDVDVTVVPEDLCPAAVKVARRLQNLPNERLYVILLTKAGREWVMSLLDDRGAKLERAR